MNGNVIANGDIKTARDAVAAYFAVYRRFVRLLDSGTVFREELQPAPGYEQARDPDSIRAPGLSFSSPGAKEIDGKLRYMSWFVRDANRLVRGLPVYQEAIIRVQYMGKEQLSNEEAYKELIDQKFFYSERKFERQRREAVLSVAETLDFILKH
ncbi:hypothetical protein [Alicyclobacillus fastidiosus]|uniref:ArpU family transcriptional regulator n=1 Tax=Alicyclobacillus fastidiosus TaxID=392011 RepID=A0ABV5ALV4_9BACL|nr:hypothetical protein [Alicyclobacillus fastidiosus]WEH08198.1 hypothetical protein PYS47_15945 [Alicyclobacillus fastidiosus]